MEKQKNIPSLRFPEFSGEWETNRFGDIYNFKVTNSFSRENLNYIEGTVKNIHYGDIHTKFSSSFNIKNEYVPYINPSVSIERIKDENYCLEGDLIMADASEDYADIGKSIEVVNLNNEKLLAGLHTFLARPNLDKISIGFAGHLMKSNSIRLQIIKEAQGTKVLSLSTTRVTNVILKTPEKTEQTKIASFLTKVDEKLTALKKKKELLEQYKKGVMQQIFSQELRFKDDDGNDYPDWEEKTLGECLDYIQPTKYLVNSTEYDNSYGTPVLTAGKTFILGYTNETKGIYNDGLPVIIFDDFTTSTQFVDFPFKVKSSAMKILISRNEVNIKFIHEAMQNLSYEIGGHERHWISKFSPIQLLVPNKSEQNKIADFVSTIDNKITYCQSQIEKAKTWKKGLLQQIFI